MKAAREYQARTSVYFIDEADVPTGYASRLRQKLIPDDIRRRIDDISEQFTGAGWKNLPQELIDEILGYLLDDPAALRAFSLTCKRLFSTTRPLIHQRLVCLDSRSNLPKPKGPLFSRRKRDPGAFDRLIDADRLGVLRYTQHLALKLNPLADYPRLNPDDLKEYLPHFQSIAKLRTLTLDTFNFHPFIPVFDKHFGMFADTLQHLDIRNADCTEQELLFIICQFPLLENLTVSPASGIVTYPRHPVPTITQSPPLRGKLVLVHIISRTLLNALAEFPGGLSFRSLELFGCRDPGAVVAACSHTMTSISYVWPARNDESESNSCLWVRIVA